MNAQQLKNSILQDIYSPKDGWVSKELKDIVADSCPISYGIVQQGNHIEGGVPVVRPVDLHCNYVRRIGLKCTTKSISDSYSRTLLRGDEILLCVRGTTGIMSLASEEIKGCNVNRGVVPLYFKKEYDRLFVYYQMQTPFIQDIISEKTTGSALKQLNIKDLRAIRLVFPPLAEQKRIVAKIEELLPKVEEYGKAQDALDKLNAELPERLKKSILQEAISGRLVPQDPNDEPASILLDKIRAEKAKLIKEKKIILGKPEKKVHHNEEVDLDIPQNWAWCQLNDICRAFGRIGFRGYTKGDLRESPEEGAITLSPSNIINDKLDTSSCTYLSWEKYNESPEIQVKKGDIILVKTASIGKCAIVNEVKHEMTVNPQFVVLKDIKIYNQYLYYLLLSTYVQDKIRNYAIGTSIPTYSQVSLISMLIPLPPLAEQHRIVAKIEQLLAEIDKLK